MSFRALAPILLIPQRLIAGLPALAEFVVQGGSDLFWAKWIVIQNVRIQGADST